MTPARSRRSLLLLPGSSLATRSARLLQDPHLPFRLAPSSLANARSCPFRFRFPNSHEHRRAFQVAPYQRARSTSTPSGSRLPACCCWLPFRLAPSSSPRPRCFRLLRRTDGHLGALHHHARLLRSPLRRLAPTVGETSVRSLLAALANDVSTALSRARFHAPLLRAARLFGPSDSSDSPCPFTRTLWA
jgi:hypothetical protein